LRDLEYKTAIVTGSGRGIGKETAILLSKMGLNVVICSRTQKEIDSTVKEIKEIIRSTKHGAAAKEESILGIKCDVSQASEIDYVVKSTIENFRSIDILVNNAGIAYVKKLIDTSEAQNVLGVTLTLLSLFPFPPFPPLAKLLSAV
jgi:3-oxoacyl-[acyl-carrier protein] reductase